MKNRIKILSSALSLAIPLVFISNSCFAWGSADPKYPVTSKNPEPRLFTWTRDAIEQKQKRKNKDPLADLYMTTSFPFFLITDIVMSPTMTTMVLGVKSKMQKHPAAWNNPNSMIAKATQK